MFSLQRFLPHNYSLDFNLAIISGCSCNGTLTLDFFCIKEFGKYVFFSFFN